MDGLCERIHMDAALRGLPVDHLSKENRNQLHFQIKYYSIMKLSSCVVLEQGLKLK